MTVVSVVTVVTVVTVATVVTVVTKQLCTLKNLNLHKTYLPTYLRDSNYCSDRSDSSDSNDSSESCVDSDSSHTKKNPTKNISERKEKI